MTNTKQKLVGHSIVCDYVDSQATLLAGHGQLGIISMFVLPPGQNRTKRVKQQKTQPTGCETEIAIKWISLKINVHSGFQNLFICAKFKYSTISRTKVGCVFIIVLFFFVIF